MTSTVFRVFLVLTVVLYISGFKLEQCPSGYRCRKRAVSGLLRSLIFQIQQEMEMEICEAGTFSPGGSDHCTSCEKGTYAAKAGAPACYSCPRGHMCPQKNVEPERCPHGTYNNVIRQTCCRSCPPGKFALFQGMFQCDDCPSGHKCKAGPKLPCEEEMIMMTTTSTTTIDTTTTTATDVDSTTATTTDVDSTTTTTADIETTMTATADIETTMTATADIETTMTATADIETTMTATADIETTMTATADIETTMTATADIETTMTATADIETTMTATTDMETTTTIATTPPITCGEPGAADDIRVSAGQIYYDDVVLHGNTLHVCGSMEGRTTGHGTVKTYDGAKIKGAIDGKIKVIVLGNTMIGR